jgi:hypothetical protein
MTRLCMILLLIAAVLGGCSTGGAREPASPGLPATLSPTTTLFSTLPRQIGTDGGYQIFEVTPSNTSSLASAYTRSSSDRSSMTRASASAPASTRASTSC